MADGAQGGERPRIRPMHAEEASTVGRLTLAAYDAYGRIEGLYREHLGDPARRTAGATAVLVAELDGRLVGTVTFVLPGDIEWERRPEPAGDAGFRILAVAPEAEGRGVGQALVEACIARARSAGARRLVVTTMAWMHRAHDLYGRLGFEHRPDLDVRFPSGVGHTLTLDLVEDAGRWFPPPGPVPDEPPWFEDVWRPRSSAVRRGTRDRCA